MMIRQSPALPGTQGHDQENESTVPEHGMPPHGVPAPAGIVTQPAQPASRSRRPRIPGGSANG